MRTRIRPLLAELHAHTTWSDGDLSVAELVDLHGRQGFDVLCVTDHVVRGDDPWRETWTKASPGVTRAVYDDYLREIAHEAERARDRYGMLVFPGVELTYNDLDPGRAAHAVAVGLHTFVPVDDGIGAAMDAAALAGAAIVAAHPFSAEPSAPHSRLTQRFARDEALRGLAHRFELFNRTTLFGWVAEAGLPTVACGDVHVAGHVAGWKTLLPCALDEEAIVAYLRSRRPTYLARLDPAPALAA
jgi:predicted metal-dependent phosphoesterase TrpH